MGEMQQLQIMSTMSIKSFHPVPTAHFKRKDNSMSPEESIPTPKKTKPRSFPIPPVEDDRPEVIVQPQWKARRASYDSVSDRLAEGADMDLLIEQGYFDE